MTLNLLGRMFSFASLYFTSILSIAIIVTGRTKTKKKITFHILNYRHIRRHVYPSPKYASSNRQTNYFKLPTEEVH